MTQCIQKEFEFQGLKSSERTRKVVASFNGGTITSDAGGPLLREVESKTRIIRQFSECFTDYRNPRYTEHSVYELVSQRIYGLALGYEDLNDHDTLRLDPLIATLTGKSDPTGQNRLRQQDKGKPLAAKSTLNRLELTPEDAGPLSRYKKIRYNKEKIEDLFTQVFLDSHTKIPEQIILDLDTTDDLIHGNQEGKFYHGYYGNYCYLPLYIFCGEFLLCAKLRTANQDASAGSTKELQRITGQIKERWPKTKIMLRADSGFAREEIMLWCEENNVDYLFGLPKNSRLKEEIASELEESKALCEKTNSPQRTYRDFTYQTLNSWSKARRVVGKAEHLPKGSNPRFVVTSIKKKDKGAKELYEKVYCARGDMENRIKEQQLYLFSDRTSAQTMRANQLRLWFSSISYLLMQILRRIGLKGTEFAKAQCHTIREKILKIGAQIKISVRRILISLAEGYPHQDLFNRILQNLRLFYNSSG